MSPDSVSFQEETRSETDAVAGKPDIQLFGIKDPDRLVFLLGLAFVIFNISLALLIGNIGFEGDDWWQFSWPYWFPFPQSIWEYAKESRRPIEGIYTVLAFESFGLNRVLYTLTALLLSSASCLLLASCMKRAFPRKASLAVLGAFFAFFLPPVSNLIYMFHTDNSRISMLFFWFSVFAFQRWTQSSCSWGGLVLPAILYLLGAFTYENTTFLIFCVPLLVWPVYAQSQKTLSPKVFLARLSVGILGAFVIFVLARFAIFSGGAVKQNSLLPSLNLIWSYIANLGFYVVYPIPDVPLDAASWLWGAPVALILAALLSYSSRIDSDVQGIREGRWEQSSLYVTVLGLLFVVLGMLPYLLAGYHSDIGFTSQSRIYSAASFGVAIILAALFTAPRSTRFRILMMTAAIGFICLMAVFLAGLRTEWRQAEIKRSNLCQSLLEQVPAVAPKTTFLFLGLQSYVSTHGVGRAVIFQGVDGLGEWIKMRYGRKDVYAYFIYPKAEVIDDDKGRRASVTPQGFNARGSVVRGPIPLDTILIVEKRRNSLHILDSLSEKDGVAAIDWKGVSEIKSNMNRIIPTANRGSRLRSICGQ